ncbi:MAG: Diacetyl reductase [(S)-acetoin forming] [Nitrospira sp.]|nr:Diacetyl reductase [(S)-acetoin forming] [Nitrospira sp.]
MALVLPMQSVVITGASTGIGAACALHLDALGFRVFAGVRRYEDGASLRVRGSQRLLPVLLDVTDAVSIAQAAAQVHEAVGGEGIAGLVNNAGIVVAGPLEVLPIAELRKQFGVNVIGALAVTQAFLPLLRVRRGRIVNMGSIAGRVTVPFLGPYSMSKFALEAMTTALRLELDGWGIEVSIVEPGAIATPIWEKSIKAADLLQASTTHDALPLYAEHFACVRRAIDEAARRAISVDAVARAVEHALTARRPRTHYLVGSDAKFRALLALLLPHRMQDVLLRWFLKFPRRR